MKSPRWFALLVVLALGCNAGGVSKAEFEAYKTDIATWKASVQSSGKQVNDWTTHAHNNAIKWLVDNAATICPKCDPPTSPPPPPPNGEW